ncbi:MAG: 3D domain-containing protein [Clostridiaceae bacterium]
MEKFKGYLKNYLSDGKKVINIIAIVLIVVSIFVISSFKQVTIAADGKEYKVTTLSSSCGAVLASKGIEIKSEDKAVPSLDSKITDGTTIKVTRAMNLKVEVDGKVQNLISAEDTIEKMLIAEGIELKDLDKVYPSRDAKLKEDLEVQVVRVKTADVIEVSPVAYSTTLKSDSSLLKGAKVVLQSGQQGEKKSVYKITYEDGAEVSRTLVSETVTKEPVAKVVASGTASTVTYSRGGDFSTAKTLRMKATAYSAEECGGRMTASGATAIRNPSGYSTIAVDPRVIPLGTKVYVEGYGYAIAQDTGGAIKGNIIDVFFDGNREMNAWGVKYVNVYILE